MLLCRRAAKFEVRKYQPFLVAETMLDNVTPAASSSSSSDYTNSNGAPPANESSRNSGSRRYNINPATAGMKAFNALAGYIFGSNAEQQKMAMTTPVLTSTAGTMQFVVATDTSQVKLVDCEPAPNSLSSDVAPVH